MALTARDGSALGKSSRKPSATRSSKLTGLPYNDSPTFETLERTIFSPSIASRRESRARMSRSPDAAPDSKESALDCFTSLRESCKNFDPLGLFSRMFPDFFLPTKAETLRKSSAFSWSSAGMGYRGVCSIADISTWPSDAKECSLSDVLESHVPQRFFLSPRAARGILRRAEKRGRTLPSHLQAALESLATSQDAGAKMISISTALTSQELSEEETGKEPTKTSKNQHSLWDRLEEAAEAEDSIRMRSKPQMVNSLRQPSENPMDTTDEAAQEEMDATILYSIMPMNSGTDYKAFKAKVAQPIMAAGQTHGNQGGDVVLCPSQRTSEEKSELARLPRNLAREEGNLGADIQQLPTLSEKTQVESVKATIPPMPSPRTCETEAKGQEIMSATPSLRCEADQMTTTPKETILCPTLAHKNEPCNSAATREEMMNKMAKLTMSVRRLTPTECETLQAFPKGWTLPDTEHWGTQSRRRSRNG
jgi:hypothetical protein